MGTITTGSFAKALWPGINKWYGMKYNEYKPEWPEIFDKNTSTKAFEEEVGATGYGLAQVKTEGASITYDDMEQGFVSRYTHITYALGFIITQEMFDDNLYSEIGLRRAQSLAFSIRQTKEVVAANVLNRAFNSSYTGGDGLELCSLLHVNKSGGTWANELATAADLSDTALEQACIDIAGFTNDRGLTIKVLPKKLIIPPDLEFEAARILKSIQQPGTANNDINAIRVLGKIPQGYCVNHFLTDADAFFIKTDAPEGMKLFQRKPMSFGTDNDFDTTNAKFKSSERYSVGWSDPRGIFGSPGA
jgi:hypothetical protein